MTMLRSRELYQNKPNNYHWVNMEVLMRGLLSQARVESSNFIRGQVNLKEATFWSISSYVESSNVI